VSNVGEKMHFIVIITIIKKIDLIIINKEYLHLYYEIGLKIGLAIRVGLVGDIITFIYIYCYCY
jgi:hypothetical protein